MKRIERIVFKKEMDYDADVSYLGEIYETRNWEIHCIPTRPDDMARTQWFSPCNHLPHNEDTWESVPQDIKDEVIHEYGSLRKADIAYAYKDLERLQAFYRNRWWMEFYCCEATIAISDDGKHWGNRQTLCLIRRHGVRWRR